jgi:chorismate mutase
MDKNGSEISLTLTEHRKSIDRLDAILVFTLAERFKQTKKVGELKAKNLFPPSDPKRESQQIKRLESLAKEADLDPEFAKKASTLYNFRSNQTP